MYLYKLVTFISRKSCTHHHQELDKLDQPKQTEETNPSLLLGEHQNAKQPQV